MIGFDRNTQLLRQVDDWDKARRLREYLVAMETAIAELSDSDEIAEARDWLEWSRRYVAQLDPLNGRLGMPSPGATEEPYEGL